MTTYARMVNGAAVDVTETDPATIFHPELAEEFVSVPDGTLNGATFVDGKWSTPVASEPTPEADALPLLTPMTLYMAFKPQERIAIKTSTDPLVQEFWAMYQLSVQLQKPTDPNLPSVREAIGYLATPVEPGPGAGILAGPERIGEILAGVPQ